MPSLSDSQVKRKNWNIANDLTCLIWPWKMYRAYLLLQTGFFPSVCFDPYFRKAVHKKWCCHKLGVVPVFKGLHGNWNTVHLGEEVVSWRGDILMPGEICNSENRAGHVTCEMARQEVSNIQASWLFTLLPHNIGQWAYVWLFPMFLMVPIGQNFCSILS